MGMPPRNTATSVDAEPRTESVPNEPSAPSLRTCTLGSSSSNDAASKTSPSAASGVVFELNEDVGVPYTQTVASSSSAACPEAVPARVSASATGPPLQ
jgi:hypothetical protein